MSKCCYNLGVPEHLITVDVIYIDLLDLLGIFQMSPLPLGQQGLDEFRSLALSPPGIGRAKVVDSTGASRGTESGHAFCVSTVGRKHPGFGDMRLKSYFVIMWHNGSQSMST